MPSWIYNIIVINYIGYYLNPQFQYGVSSSRDVYSETLQGATRVIERIEPDVDKQIRMYN